MYFILQALTKLHHENVVALYDCKVRQLSLQEYLYKNIMKSLKLISFWCRNLIIMSSWLWSIVMVEIWEII